MCKKIRTHAEHPTGSKNTLGDQHGRTQPSRKAEKYYAESKKKKKINKEERSAVVETREKPEAYKMKGEFY